MPKRYKMTVEDAVSVEMIREGIWAGYITENTLQSEVEDLCDGPPSAKEAVLSVCQQLFEEKKAAEVCWPEATDVDRLISAFSSLRKDGVYCYFTDFWEDEDEASLMSAALSEQLETLRKCEDPATLGLLIRSRLLGACVCSLEEIDVFGRSSLHLMYLELEIPKPDDSVGIGDRIAHELARRGLDATRTGNEFTIAKFDWKKRGIDRLPFLLSDEIERLRQPAVHCDLNE